MNSFNVEGVIAMPLLVPVRKMLRRENGDNFLTEEDYTQCYRKGHRARIKNLVFEQVISRATVHHACPEP